MRLRKGLFAAVIAFMLMACGSSTDSESNMDLSTTDSIFEYQENEQKLTAVEFNNELTNMQNGILNQIDALFQSDSSSVDINLENAIFETNLNLNQLSGMTEQKGAEGFVSAMKDLMSFYKDELSNNFEQVKFILKKPVFSDEDKVFLDEYDLSFATKEEELFKNVFAEQEKYAKQNNILLEEL